MTDSEIVSLIRPWQCFFDLEAELPAILRAFEGRKRILEIGTYKGATSAALALAHLDAKVTTVDLPDPSKSAFNPQSSDQCGIAIHALALQDRVEQVRFDSSVLVQWAGSRRFDGIFVDADHSTAAVKRDLVAAAKLLEPGGVIVVHDYTDERDGSSRPWWTIDVCEGVRQFIAECPKFYLTRMPGWLASLRERP